MTKQTQTDSALALGFGKDWFQKLQAKAKYNIYQAEYYDRMAEDYHDELFHRKAEKTLNCSKVWHLDYYKKHGIKNIREIIRCNDNFCYVCQSLKAQRRYDLYAPLLKELETDYDIYHVIITVPNVTGAKLKWTLDKMTNRFSRLIEYFSGHKKIKGLDFGKYGYAGAVRSLEITTGKRKQYGDFHPHFHCMVVLKKGLNLPKIVENSFSKTKTQHGEIVRTKFSALEVLLQKIWCLLMLDIPVTKDNLRNMRELTEGKYKDGFDVVANNARGKYHEIFKYAIKGTYKQEKIFSYEDMCCLYDALKNRRTYQTYGCLQKHNFNEVDDMFNPTLQTDYLWKIFLEKLQSLERPIRIESCIEEILQDFTNAEKRKIKPIRYMGPATLRKAFAGLSDEERLQALEKLIQKLEEGD